MKRKNTLNHFYEPILIIGFLLFGLAAMQAQTVDIKLEPNQCVGMVNSSVVTTNLPQGQQEVFYRAEDIETDLNLLGVGEHWISVRIRINGQDFYSEKVGLWLAECSTLDCESLQQINNDLQLDLNNANNQLAECQVERDDALQNRLNECNKNLALSNQLYNDCLSKNNYDSLLNVYLTVRQGLDNYIEMVRQGQAENNKLQTTNDSLLLVLGQGNSLLANCEEANKDMTGVLEQTNNQLANCQLEKDSIKAKSDLYLADLIETNEQLVECTFQEPSLRDTCLTFYSYLNGCACTMEVTPNPNVGELTINVVYDVGTDVKDVSIQIVELSGKVVKSYDTNNAQVTGLERGEYKAVAKVRCTDKTNTITKTIIVQ